MIDDTESKPLPPRRAAFVEAYTDPSSPTFGNGTQSVIAAGYAATPAARVEATRLLASDSVQSRVRAALEAAGVTDKMLAGRMRKYFEDEDRKVRPSSVRAGEILMRAAGLLQPDSLTITDARSIILPGAQTASLESLETLLSTLPEPESEAT